jgi:hypothetical protein
VHPRQKIIELRELLAEKYPQQEVKTCGAFPTGVEEIDQALSGGLPQGAITEVTSACGGGLLLVSLLQKVEQARAFVALIDGRDSFDPATVKKCALRRLLWVRCHSAELAVKAADLLLRDGNLPLAVLDLRSNTREELRAIPATAWYRLQRVVEPTATAFLVLTRKSLVSSARVKLQLEGHFTLDAFAQRQADLTKALGAHATDVSRIQVRQFA